MGDPELSREGRGRSSRRPRAAHMPLGSAHEQRGTPRGEKRWWGAFFREEKTNRRPSKLEIGKKNQPHIAWVMGEGNNQEIMYAHASVLLDGSNNTPSFISLTIIPMILALVVGSSLRKRVLTTNFLKSSDKQAKDP